MNLRWMMLFATIAEERSFTRAATRLNIAQPWLSAQMRKLEYELGVQLLIRESAGVKMTPEGEILLPYAQQLSEAARMFRQIARTMGDAQSKTVRIGSHMPMLDLEGTRRINRDFARRYSNFSLTVAVDGTPNLLQRLNNSEFDLVVALSPLPVNEGAFDVIALGPAQPYLLARRDSKLTSVEDLSGKTIGVPPNAWHPDFLNNLLNPLTTAGAQARTVPEFDRRAMEHLVKAHSMVVIMVDDESQAYASDPELTVLPLSHIQAQHLLVRVKGRELGRGAERYWSLAKGRGH
jgi:DNA-binding transcriptional LysR family regulator